jgi:hypothetical protein
MGFEHSPLTSQRLAYNSADGLQVSGWLTKSVSADKVSHSLTKSKSFSEPLTGILREICGHIFIKRPLDHRFNRVKNPGLVRRNSGASAVSPLTRLQSNPDFGAP